MDVKFFVFLELLDEEINALLNSLRKIFMEVRSTSNIHITIRGPYTEQLPAQEISDFETRLRNRLKETNDSLLLHGIREFETEHDGKYHVAIRIQCESLKSVWWKPDYPIEQYGFNPHVTLYSGRDIKARDAISTFLKAEDLRLICAKFALGSHVTRQASLMFEETASGEVAFRDLIDRGRIKPGILSRASNLVLPFLRKNLEEGLDIR